MQRNCISIDDLKVLLRGNLPEPVENKYSGSNLDKVIEHHEDLVKELILKARTVTAHWLKAAAMQAYNMKSLEAKLFGDRMHDALSYIAAKAKSMSSGAKLSPSVHRLAIILKETKEGSPPSCPAIAPARSRSSQEIVTRSIARSSSSQEIVTISPVKPKSARNSGPDSRDDIMALYGADPGKPLLGSVADARKLSVQISLSSEDGDARHAAASSTITRPSPKGATEDPKFKQYLDSGRRRMVRVFANGKILEATMTKGEGAFAVAKFPDEDPIDTEMPNMLLNEVPFVKKRPAGPMKAKAMKAMKAMKTSKKKDDDAELGDDDEDEGGEEDEEGKKGEAEEEKDEAEEEKDEEDEAAKEEEPEAEDSPVEKKEYLKMYYKNSNSFGIRQKFGSKRQIFNISNKTWKKQDLEKVADEALGRLHGGHGEAETKTWAKNQTHPAR